MTTPKEVSDQVKPAAKRARRKASPKSAEESSLQPDLLGGSAPVAPDDSGPVVPVQASVTEQTPSAVRDRRKQSQPASPVPAEVVAAGPEESLAPVRIADAGQAASDAGPSWLLATNHLNMLYMLAAGMVMGPAGFAGKHYRDPSSDVPGQIPIFRDGCPEAAIRQSVSEKGHLRACIAEIDLSGVEGLVCLVSSEGVVTSASIPSGMDPSATLLLMPAPLPVSRVKSLAFRSHEDLKEFEVSARSVANIDLSGLRVVVNEELFSRTSSAAWPLPEQAQGSAQVVVDQRPARGEAIGGVLAMLYQLANRSELCSSAYNIASGECDDHDLDAVQADPVLAELAPWVEEGSLRPVASVQARLYWGAVQALLDARSGGSKKGAVDVVLDFLEGQLAGAHKSDHQVRLERLISDMRSTFGLGGGTISQLFERHRGTLSRPLLLLCLRERCVDLLEFSHPDLRDEELVLAAVLFGVRDGWVGLPVGLRAAEGLSRFVEYRMFEVETSRRKPRISLAPAPPRPVTLRELLAVTKDEWSKTRSSFVTELLIRLGWNDCLVSRIRFPLGQYRLSITEAGAEIVVRGVVDTPAIDVDRAALLKRVAQWPPVSDAVESELRAALTSESRS